MLALIAILLSALQAGGDSDRPRWRLRAEFERQGGLLISASELADGHPDLFVTIVAGSNRETEIVALVNNQNDVRIARDLLKKNKVPHKHVRFVELPHDTKWARDYGPFIVEGRGGTLAAIDTGYGYADRPGDDESPTELARRFAIPVLETSLVLQGGNLLTNGRGLGVTSRRTVTDNTGDKFAEENLSALLCELFGFTKVLYLEPLIGESTGHVDMFATFVSKDTVVVGQYDPAEDAENAAVLDRNAERLEKAGLTVVRIPMPDHRGNTWRTYTNIVFVNRTVLIPQYPGFDDEGGRRALTLYKQLLRGRKVYGIDANNLIDEGGALHCVTRNLGRFHRWPREGSLPRRPLKVSTLEWEPSRRENGAAPVPGTPLQKGEAR